MKTTPFIKFIPVLLFTAIAAAAGIPALESVAEPVTIGIVLLAVLFFAFSALSEAPYYPIPKSFKGVYGTGGNKTALAGSLAIGILLMLLMLLSVVLNVLALRDKSVSGMSAVPYFILAVIKILAAVAFMVILSHSNYGEAEQIGSTRAAAFIIIIFACYNLILIYRGNAANPTVREFAWQVLTLSSFALMWMYMLGLTAGKQYRSIRLVRFFTRVTAVLSGAAAAHCNNGAVLSELIFCFVCAALTDILLSANIASNIETQHRILENET